MNEIVNKCLLTGDKFMPEMHLKQPAFTYSACGPFTKNKKRIQKFKETADSRYIYRHMVNTLSKKLRQSISCLLLKLIFFYYFLCDIKNSKKLNINVYRAFFFFFIILLLFFYIFFLYLLSSA